MCAHVGGGVLADGLVVLPRGLWKEDGGSVSHPCDCNISDAEDHCGNVTIERRWRTASLRKLTWSATAEYILNAKDLVNPSTLSLPKASERTSDRRARSP